MALNAGSVYATLGARVNPGGFAQYDAAVKKTIASAAASERAGVRAAERTAAAQAAMGAAANKAAADVARLTLAQQRAALGVERAQIAQAAAIKKSGAESLKARQATLSLTAAQQRHAAVSAQLAAAQERAAIASADMDHWHRRNSESIGRFGQAANGAAKWGLAALAVGAAASVKKAMDFEKAMSEVQAVTKANTRDFKRLGDSAKDLGAKTGVGATAAAGALAELAKGGLSTEQTITALNGTIAMSQAGGMDLAEAATTVAQALNLFDMEGGKASHVADAFATAANKTTADVGFFAQGLAQGGAAAKAAGLNFDQTTAALEIMAANGFKSGSDAGTSLKTALTQLAHPTKKAEELTKKLGLSFFDQNGEMKSLGAVSSMLRDKMGGLTRQQRLAAAATLVGQDGMRALLALYDQGPRKVQKFQQGLKEQGTAQDVARTKMDNLSGDWQKFTANLETVGIDIGSKLIPKLRDLSQSLADITTDFQRDKPHSGFVDFVKQIGGALGDASSWSWDFVKEGVRSIQYLSDAMENWHPPKVDLTLDAARSMAPDLRAAKGPKLAPIVQKIIADDSSPREKLAALKALKIPDKTARFILQSGGVDAAIARITTRLAGVRNPPPIAVRVKDEASSILHSIVAKPLRAKVQTILANDDDVQAKVAALQALGISGPTANFLANTAGIENAKDVLNGTKYEVPVKYTPNVMQPTLPFGLETHYTVRPVVIPANVDAGKRAAGRGPAGHETSLVGEGGGPEFVGNPRDGWRRVDAAALMRLRPEDYVIPTEQKYRGRALQLMADALGFPAFKKGKKGKGKAKPIHADPIKFAQYLGPLESEVQKWEERVQRDESKKDEKANSGKRKGKLTREAREARRKLPHERSMLRQAKRELKSAKDYGKRIEAQEELANIYADDMELATTESAWLAARKKRTDALGQERKLLEGALKLAGGPQAKSAWARALRKRMGETDIGIRDAGTDTFDASTFTPDQQARLDQIDARLALAELTPEKADDAAALTEKAGFLEPLLAQAQAAGRSTAVSEIAGMLKTTRDALSESSKPADVTADQQATTDQAVKRAVADMQSRAIDRTIDRAFSGPLVQINTLHPGSPEVARALGDAAAAGFGYQRPRPAPTARVGV